MATDRVRWGILSTADIALRKVIPGMRAAERTEVLAIASRDGERARSAAEALGIPRAYAGYEALLADPDVDAVYIPLPNHLHPEWAMRAATAGKHVLCEKPLAMHTSQAREMVDTARAAGVLLMEAFMYRLHPSWLAVRDLVASGRIGRLVAVDSWFAYHNDDPANIRNIREFGGGALYDIGCYAVNLSRLLFGGEPDRVQAAITRDPVTGCDIVTSAILSFAGGTATFTCGTLMEPDQRVDVYGTEGRIHLPIPFNIPPHLPTEVRLIAGGDPPVAPATEVLTFPPKDPYAAEVEGFAAAVLDGRGLPTPPEDAVANLEVIEAVFAAAG
jgi:predicted dehydrogenase